MRVNRVVEVIRTEGAAGVWLRLRFRLNRLKQRLHIGIPHDPEAPPQALYPHVPVDERLASLDGTTDSLNVMVSVIVPTDARSTDLRELRRRLSMQWGIRGVELVSPEPGANPRAPHGSRAPLGDPCMASPAFRIGLRQRIHNLFGPRWSRRPAAKVVVFIDPDTLPVGRDWLARLVSPIAKGEADAVCARAIPYANTGLFEKWAALEYAPLVTQVVQTLHSADSGRGDHGPPSRNPVHCLHNGTLAIRAHLLDHGPAIGDPWQTDTLLVDFAGRGIRLHRQQDNAVIHSPPLSALEAFRLAERDTRFITHGDGTSHGPAVLGSLARAYQGYRLALERAGDLYAMQPSATIRELTTRLGPAMTDASSAHPVPVIDKDFEALIQQFSVSAALPEFVSEITTALQLTLDSLAKYLAPRKEWCCAPEQVDATLEKAFALAAGIVTGRNGCSVHASRYRQLAPQPNSEGAEQT